MNNDRELLKLAAKAAGIDAKYSEEYNQFFVDNDVIDSFFAWNPLTDDGDALRLAVELGMDMYFGDDEGTPTFNAGSSLGEGKPFRYCIEPIGDDPYAATRRAIVRAAAEIGKGMK